MNDSHEKTGHNRLQVTELRGFVERLERLRAEKKAIGDDESVVMAEAKAAGYTPAGIRYVIKQREKTPAEREESEALRDMYMEAMGMGAGPLFRFTTHFGSDELTRDALVTRLSDVMFEGGEIIIKGGGDAVRISRERGGESKVEDYREPVAPKPGKPGKAGKAGATAARPWPHDIPDCTDAEAEALGADAYGQNIRVIDNPFPPADKRRPLWDLGWRGASGSDGMGPDPAGDDD